MSEVLFCIIVLAVVLLPLLFLVNLIAGIARQSFENEEKARRYEHEQWQEERRRRKREFQRWYDGLR